MSMREQITSVHSLGTYQSNYHALRAIAEEYRRDDALRERIDSGDVSPLLDRLDFPIPENMEVKIVADTPETLHIILPPDPNALLSDEDLGSVAGGKTAGSAGSVGTASTMACLTTPSSVGTASSAGSVGTAT